MDKKYYTVSEVSKLTGVNIKTLHYYQTIGVLSPHKVGDNKYRYYTEEEIDLLQEILCYRSMNISLKDIKGLLCKTTNMNRLDILTNQLTLMKKQAKEMNTVIETLENTIDAIKEDKDISYQEKFNNLAIDDSIYTFLQTMIILCNKPISIVCLCFGLFLLYFHGQAVITNTSILGSGTGGIITSFCFVVISIFILLVSLRNILKINTKKWLSSVNSPYKK